MTLYIGYKQLRDSDIGNDFDESYFFMTIHPRNKIFLRQYVQSAACRTINLNPPMTSRHVSGTILVLKTYAMVYEPGLGVQ